MQILPVESLDLVEWNSALAAAVVEVAMRRAGDDHELLVVAIEHFERRLAEVAAVRLFTVNHKNGTFDLASVGEELCVEEREEARLVPAVS